MITRALCITAVLGLINGTALAEETRDRAILDKDFALMMDWFPGRYDNNEQVAFQGEMGMAEEDRHERIHHIFAPVDLPAFEGTTFYVEQYQDGDPDKIYRQRIYSFHPDYDEMAIRLDIYTPKDAAALEGAHEDASKLDDLSQDDVITRPGCEVFWQRQANQFIGSMKEGACTFFSERSGKQIIIEDDLVLTEDEIWIADRAKDADGNHVFGRKDGVPHKNRKARDFTCWAAVKREQADGFTFVRGVALHDQGGMAWVESDETPAKKVGLKMRNVVWPYGPNRPSRVLYIYEEGNDRAVSYAWSAPENDRIGINLRWMQASCTGE